MKKSSYWQVLVLAAFVFCLISGSNVLAADPVVIGVPTSLGFLEGKESLKAVQMAVDEINGVYASYYVTNCK